MTLFQTNKWNSANIHTGFDFLASVPQIMSTWEGIQLAQSPHQYYTIIIRSPPFSYRPTAYCRHYRRRSAPLCTRRSLEREWPCRRCPLCLWDFDSTIGEETGFDDLLCLLDVLSGDALIDCCLGGDAALDGFLDRRLSLYDGEDFLISADDECLDNTRLSAGRSLSWRDRLSPPTAVPLLTLFSARRPATGRGLRLELLDLLQSQQHRYFTAQNSLVKTYMNS